MPTAGAARGGRRVERDEEPYGEEYEEEHETEDQYEGEAYSEDEAYDEGESDRRVTTATAAAAAAVDQITQLTAKQAEGVVAVEPGDEGWRVSVEVIEDQRIPSSADILAVYEAAIASSGDLTSYRRIRRYGRGHGDGGYDQ